MQNINQVDLENFEEIQKTFYLKIISENKILPKELLSMVIHHSS